MGTPARHTAGDARSPEERWPTGYCLYCYAPLPPIQRAGADCPACGRFVLKEDQRRYRTLEPGLVSWQRTFELAVGTLVVALMAAMLAFPTPASGATASGMGVGGPIVVGLVLWQTAQAITRKRTLLRLRIVWPVLFGLGIFLSPVLFVPPVGHALEALFGRDIPTWGRWLLGLAVIVPPILCLIGLPASLLLRDRYARWLRHRIRRRSRGARASSMLPTREQEAGLRPDREEPPSRSTGVDPR